MRNAVYEITSTDEGWAIQHDGDFSGPYDTADAAFEAAFASASFALQRRMNVSVSVVFSEESRDAPQRNIGSFDDRLGREEPNRQTITLNAAPIEAVNPTSGYSVS